MSDDMDLDAKDLDQLTNAKSFRLHDLIDRDFLREVISSFVSLFGISTRVYASDGSLLADAVNRSEICTLVNKSGGGRAACLATIETVKGLVPDEEEHVEHPCFIGAVYHVTSLFYDGRNIGRIVLGPYLPADVTDVPAALFKTAEGVTPADAKALLPKLPRANRTTVQSIARHLRSVLDLILFSGHKALLTSEMHLVSVRESYRELQEKNHRLESAYEKLKELDRLKSNFIATVSHELRTPLTSIIGYSEMLDEGIAGDLSEEQKEFIGTIREKSEQLLGLIMSLLDLSKLESGTMSLIRTRTDVRKVLDDVNTLLLPNARKKGVNVIIKKGSPLPELNADPNRLRQVFLNLAENAVKFTPEGGSVTLEAAVAQHVDADGEDAFGFALIAPTKQFIDVRVTDTGVGIPEDQRDRVFDPFFQVDSSSTREFGGTGLGLSIVKRLVDAHDGKIRVEANQPKGTVFIVSLPISIEDTGPDSTRA